PPRVGVLMELPEDDHVVVAKILPEANGRTTPASKAGIPEGAVIVAAAGQPVSLWADLSEAFRTHAGQSIKLRYRQGLSYHEATFDVPEDLASRLDLPADPYIQEIDGRSEAEVVSAKGEVQKLFLPSWQAVRDLLKKSIGKTVTVKY